MRRLASVLALAVVFALGVGCAPKQVQKEWMAVGGSRADATIKLAYSYLPQNEAPIVSQQQAIELATKKCQTWGYEGAEPFGSAMENCAQLATQPFGGMMCMKMNVTAEFQCIGKLPPDIENVSPAMPVTKSKQPPSHRESSFCQSNGVKGSFLSARACQYAMMAFSDFSGSMDIPAPD